MALKDFVELLSDDLGLRPIHESRIFTFGFADFAHSVSLTIYFIVKTSRHFKENLYSRPLFNFPKYNKTLALGLRPLAVKIKSKIILKIASKFCYPFINSIIPTKY